MNWTVDRWEIPGGENQLMSRGSCFQTHCCSYYHVGTVLEAKAKNHIDRHPSMVLGGGDFPLEQATSVKAHILKNVFVQPLQPKAL